MPVKINGATSGSVNITAPVSGSDVTLTLPGTTMDLGSELAAKLATADYNPGLVLVASQSFSAVSSVSVNNCFTATYSGHLIRIKLTNSTSGYVDMRLRVSGVNAATAYTRQYISATGATVTGSSVGTTEWSLDGNAFSGAALLEVRLEDAAAASATYMHAHTWTVQPRTTVLGGSHTTATAYDGFSLYPNTGTITGTVRVYGLRNS